MMKMEEGRGQPSPPPPPPFPALSPTSVRANGATNAVTATTTTGDSSTSSTSSSGPGSAKTTAAAAVAGTGSGGSGLVSSSSSTSTRNKKSASSSSSGKGEGGEGSEGWNVPLWKILWGAGNEEEPKSDSQSNLKRGMDSMAKQKMMTGKLEHTTWISALQLALWDNIFGPRVDQIWYGTEEIDEDTRLSAARHSLSGEIDDDLPLDANIESKFHVFSGIGYVVMALIFTAPNRNSPTRFSLSLIFRRTHLERYLVLHQVIQEHMTQLVSKLKAVLVWPQRAMALERFSKFLPGFVRHTEALYHSSLPPVKCSTIFCTQENTYKYEFLARAITSHLQTHGSTVVIGNDEDSVNTFVDSLSLFLTPNEKKRSRRALEGATYVPDLILQGITRQSIPRDQVILSMLPTTLIDIDRQSVKHTRVYHEYIHMRREYMLGEVDRLSSEIKTGDDNRRRIIPMRQNSLSGSNSSLSLSNLFGQLKESAPCVERMLLEAFKLPPTLREGFVAQWIRVIARRAVTLIKYAEAEKKRLNATMLEMDVIQKVRADLKLSADADFLVILGIAEKLSPGVYTTLAGDPLLMEERFIELFESFALS